jgi:hypothetical protein
MEQFWHLEAATSVLSLEFLGPFSCSSTSKIQVLDLVPCPTMEKVRVKKMEKKLELGIFRNRRVREVIVRTFSKNLKLEELELDSFQKIKSWWS